MRTIELNLSQFSSHGWPSLRPQLASEPLPLFVRFVALVRHTGKLGIF
ncbi:hypothetical protein LMG28138_00182 [Pararobbsia alpina]|uniref:Uncharacterized protein n=1 Tax=Pararobbsia alpina TaxID=621374 RepID=A0A6S7CBY0_9BURK|nr:hypothetical protein LMG28138_00182 [Pararobbsia alpina]